MGSGNARPSDRAMAALATRQHGIVSRRQLVELGLGPGAIRRRLESGRLHRVHRGVFAVGHLRLSQHGQWMAAVLSCGTAALLSHRSAGVLWGVAPYAGRWIDVTAPGSRRPTASGSSFTGAGFTTPTARSTTASRSHRSPERCSIWPRSWTPAASSAHSRTRTASSFSISKPSTKPSGETRAAEPYVPSYPRPPPRAHDPLRPRAPFHRPVPRGEAPTPRSSTSKSPATRSTPTGLVNGWSWSSTATRSTTPAPRSSATACVTPHSRLPACVLCA